MAEISIVVIHKESTHPLFFNQLRVKAQDGADPPKSSTAVLAITVERNLYAPVFQPQRIDISLLETQELGVAVSDVNATDEDTKVRLVEN